MVDTEQTGKKLIQHGELRRRYTIIPLNKISARSISADVVNRAENLVSCKKRVLIGRKRVFGVSDQVRHKSGFRNQRECILARQQKIKGFIR